jgi:acyl-CoA thioesterase-1
MHQLRITFLLILLIIVAGCGNGRKPSSAVDTTKTASESLASKSVKKTILYFGDSLTAGYGLDDPGDAYPSVVQLKIDSAKLPYTTVNAGLSGETSAGGLGRIDWQLKQHLDVFILELGANDGLRGIPVKETTKNLQAIIDKVKAKYPDAKLVMLGMQVPPNMGPTYTAGFKNIFPTLAAKNDMTLVPFLLQDVGGIRDLNQGDGIHPNVEGAKILANNVWQVLKRIL